MNFYSFHIGDYASKTRHLSWDQNFAYRLLIEIYYAYEKPLPLEHAKIYRLVSANTSKQKAAVDSVINEFFIETTEGYRHTRCDEEIAAAASKRAKASVSAHKRWDGERNASAYADAMPTHSEGNAPNPNPNPNPNPIIPNPSRDAFEETDAALRKIEGIEQHPIFADPVIAPIWQLVQQGMNLKTQIIPSIARQLKNSKAKRITRWSYFVPGILEDNKISNSLPPIDEEKWKSRLEIARRKHEWDVKNWGPLPTHQGCWVPKNLLAPTDGKDWTEWQAA